VDAGKLRDRILIQRATTARDGAYNSKVPTWVNLNPGTGYVWGHAADVADRNTEGGANKVHENTRRREVCIRWQAGIATSMRLKVNGEAVYYQIVSMAELGYRDEIRLMVEEYRS
jgi:head-tail adaptor